MAITIRIAFPSTSGLRLGLRLSPGRKLWPHAKQVMTIFLDPMNPAKRLHPRLPAWICFEPHFGHFTVARSVIHQFLLNHPYPGKLVLGNFLKRFLVPTGKNRKHAIWRVYSSSSDALIFDSILSAASARRCHSVELEENASCFSYRAFSSGCTASSSRSLRIFALAWFSFPG